MTGQLTNEEFGARVGVSVSMASKLRSGSRLPGTTTLLAISRVFDVSLQELTEAKAAAEGGDGLVWQRLLQRATSTELIPG